MAAGRAAPRRPRGLGASAALALAAAATTTTLGAPALGSEPIPVELRELLALSYTPACTLCHAHAADADAGPADTPFAAALVARGLAPSGGTGAGGAGGADVDDGLAPALDAMRRDGVDSDGDGARDLDELSWGGDPNRYDGPKADDEPLRYGCSVDGGDGGAWQAAGALVLLAAVWGRRRLARRFRRQLVSRAGPVRSS